MLNRLRKSRAATSKETSTVKRSSKNSHAAIRNKFKYINDRTSAAHREKVKVEKLELPSETLTHFLKEERRPKPADFVNYSESRLKNSIERLYLKPVKQPAKRPAEVPQIRQKDKDKEAKEQEIREKDRLDRQRHLEKRQQINHNLKAIENTGVFKNEIQIQEVDSD